MTPMTPKYARSHARILAAIESTGSVSAAARSLGISRSVIYGHLGPAASPSPSPSTAAIVAEVLRQLGAASPAATQAPSVPPDEPRDAMSAVPAPDACAAVLAALRRRPMTLEAMADRLGVEGASALRWIEAERARGMNLENFGGTWSVEKVPPAGKVAGEALEYVSRPDNTYLFGAMGDTHLCSKYERLDVLDDLYDFYAQEGVDRVFHTGNWVDGEARFNKYDLSVHGMDAQLRYLAERYPARDGIATYAVAGDDHEGWYGQNSGVDIGRYCEAVMRDRGREDWHHIGYMEAYVTLRNANTGAESKLAVVHPGMGASYALSYSIQKVIESLEGGEKPAVGLYGHWHKMLFANIRNVWCLLTGCTMDQSPFMRKKRIEAHVGGCMVKLVQDPQSGAIVSCTPTLKRYFSRSFYVNNRWSHSGNVAMPERA